VRRGPGNYGQGRSPVEGAGGFGGGGGAPPSISTTFPATDYPRPPRSSWDRERSKFNHQVLAASWGGTRDAWRRGLLADPYKK
jgi:hypothetical protein